VSQDCPERVNQVEGTCCVGNQNWTRPKPKERTLPALELLEYRQTVSDTFFVSLQAAGVSLLGAIAAEKARDPFGLTNPLDISISGGSDRPPVPMDPGRQDSTFLRPVLADKPQTNSAEVGVSDRAVLEEPIGGSSEARVGDVAANGNEDDLPIVLGSSALEEATPRQHGVIRKLQLAPPAFAVRGSTTFTADTATSLPPSGQFEIPQPAKPPGALEAIPATPTRPIIPAGGGAGDSNATTVSAQDSADAPAGAGAERDTAIVAPGDILSSQVAASTFGAGGVIPCPITTSPGQSGGGPIGTSCEPQMLLSSSSLPVLNWESNHGLVAFPGVIEYDQPLQWVELRGQDCDSYCLL
jgi:hypothetical protein